MKYVLSAILVLAATTIFAQDKRGEVFIGYSNLQAGKSFDDLGNLNNFRETFKRNGMNGVEASITGFPTAWFGITGDFSYHRKSDNTSITGGTSNYEREAFYFLAGPTLKIRNASRVEPYAHALFGAAHLRERYAFTTTATTGNTQFSIEPNTTRFAMGVGGGLDVRLGSKFSLRLVQVDYTPVFTGDRIVTFSNNSIRLDKSRVDSLRISTGIVF
jgi:opacity protein-like surface antigen